jgi:predicted CXXCH cytochrome family protein
MRQSISILRTLFAAALLGFIFAIAPSAIASSASQQNPDAACAQCHKQIYDSYERTPMARASGGAVDGLIPGEFVHAASSVHYRLFLKDGKAWLSYQRASSSPVRSLDGKQELLYYLGSGKRGRTYLFQQEGFWFEIPVNWYAKKKVWDMAPNYLDAKEMPLTLPVDPGCLRCHVSGVQPSLPGARNHFAGAPFTHGGIGCEACHGDPSAHLAKNGRGPILNPDKLGAVQRDSICLQCHLEGEVSIARAGHTLTSYRPGDNLFDHVAYFVHKHEAGPAGRATSQWEALLESKCKQKSGDRLTCATCHDPHSSPAPEERVSFYRGKCLSCHNDAAFVEKHHPENPDCASCHMPRQSTEDIAHEQVTDHRIQRVPDLTIQGTAATSQELTTIDHLPATSREYGLAYAQLAQHGDRFAQSEALRFLQTAEASASGKSNDPELHTQLGFLQQISGNKAQAEREYATALHDDPLNGTAAGDLAILKIQSGDTADAVRLWQSVFGHDPAQLAAGYDLAVTQCALGNSAAALQTMDRLLRFSPDNGHARQFAFAIRRGSEHCGGSQ